MSQKMTHTEDDATLVAAHEENAEISLVKKGSFVIRFDRQVSPQVTNAARDMGYVVKSIDSGNGGISVQFKEE